MAHNDAHHEGHNHHEKPTLRDLNVKFMERPIDTKPKLLNKMFGTHHTLSLLKKLSPVELGHLRYGSSALAFLFGLGAYFCYRKHYEQKYVISSSYYKLNLSKQIDAGNQFMHLKNVDQHTVAGNDFYYRMPEKEFNILYRMKSAYLNGYFDHNKEILFPQKKNGEEGYKVITPFYYYMTNSVDYKHGKIDNTGKISYDNITLKAGMAVDRGWIPAHLKDRRTRPYDFNNNPNETIYGTLKLRTKLSHDFEEPNDPTRELWNNFCLEDFAYYWDLPNAVSAKYVYFQQLNFKGLDPTKDKDSYPIKTSIGDAIVEDGKEKHLRLDRPYSFFTTLFAGSASLCWYLYYLAL